MVRRHIDQIFRTRNFKVRNERIVTGVQVNTQKGSNVSVEKRQGACHQWKAKRTVQKEMLAVSATTTVSVERKHHRPLLLQDRSHKMTEEDLRMEVPPEAAVHQEGDVKNRAKNTSKGNRTSPSEAWSSPAPIFKRNLRREFVVGS